MATSKLRPRERAELLQAVDALADHALIGEREAAAVTGLAVTTMQRYRWAGGGPMFCKLGTGPRGRVRYRVGDVRSWLAAQLSPAVVNTAQAAAATKGRR